MSDKDDITQDIAALEADIEELQKSIAGYDQAKQNTETSRHIEELLASLRDIEHEVKELPEIIETLSKNSPTEKE
jgi:septation ring formation regulator EzrA